MAGPTNTVESLVFQKAIRRDTSHLSFDSQMLSVLAALDGKKNLQQVGRTLGMDMDILKQTVAKLVKLNLVERVEAVPDPAAHDFMEHLSSELALAMGPVAKFALEDAVRELGYSVNLFPSGRIVDLINNLSGEIQNEEKKLQFKKEMLQKMKEYKY